MKIMRSTKAGSVCADCAAPINVGDPIAYFGPRSVYGLTCHSNDKTKKHLAQLLKEEAASTPAAQEKNVTEALNLSVETKVALQKWSETPRNSPSVTRYGEDAVRLLDTLCALWGVEVKKEA